MRRPELASHFWTANAWDWRPPRRFRYVYSASDCVPEESLADYALRLPERCVEAGGTLIVGAYGSRTRKEPARDVAAELAAAGLTVAGASTSGVLPDVRVAWIRT